MNTLRYIICIISCFSLLSAGAQTKHFERNNPKAIPLDEATLEALTAGYWRVYQDDFENRGNVTSKPRNVSMCYYPDGALFFNGSTGTWRVLENRYIEHKLDSKTAEGKLNFGGIFSITALGDSSLVLTKLLTSSHDMKRTMYLKPSTTLTMREQPASGSPYFFDGTLDAQAVDSLSRMGPDALFDVGITVMGNDMIHIFAPDSLYVIKLKSR